MTSCEYVGYDLVPTGAYLQSMYENVYRFSEEIGPKLYFCRWLKLIRPMEKEGLD